VDLAHAKALSLLTGTPGRAWHEQPLPDVEVRDLAVYERVSSLEGMP
jgi:hypothetical protein